MSTFRRLLIAMIAPVLLAGSATSFAQKPPADAPSPEANKLFEEASAELDAHKYESACPKLESVTRLSPDGIGARLALAECYEGWGKLASAWRQYVAAEGMATRAKQDSRVKEAAAKAAQLKARLASLTIDLSASEPSLPGFTVLLDGTPTAPAQWGVPIPADKGPHTVVVSAVGHGSQTVRVDIARDGLAQAVAVPAFQHAAPGAGASAAPAESASAAPSGSSEPDEPESRGRIPGILLGSSGLAAIIVGGVLLGVSGGKTDEAVLIRDGITKAGGYCAGAFHHPDCGRLKEALSSSDTFGNASLIGFAAGGAIMVAAAAYLLWPESKPDSTVNARVIPAVAPGAAGIAISGSF